MIYQDLRKNAGFVVSDEMKEDESPCSAERLGLPSCLGTSAQPRAQRQLTFDTYTTYLRTSRAVAYLELAELAEIYVSMQL